MHSSGDDSMKKPPRRPMERGVSLLPSIFTVGTLACGFYCLLSTLRGVQALTSGGPGEAAVEGFDHAARAIGWAVVFDGLDGRIARMTRTASNFGREFDSMADVVTFGLAPAILAYAWGMRWLTLDAAPGWALRLQPLSWIICFAFLICGAAEPYICRRSLPSPAPSAARLCLQQGYEVMWGSPGNRASGESRSPSPCRRLSAALS